MAPWEAVCVRHATGFARGANAERRRAEMLSSYAAAIRAAGYDAEQEDGALRVTARGGHPMTVTCSACEEPGWVLCPDGYCPDCCDAAEHSHEPAREDAR